MEKKKREPAPSMKRKPEKMTVGPRPLRVRGEGLRAHSPRLAEKLRGC